MEFGQASSARMSPALTAAPSASLGQTLAQAFDALVAAHTRLAQIEDAVLGPQPRGGNAEKDPGPNGITDLSMGLRSSLIALNERLDKFGTQL